MKQTHPYEEMLDVQAVPPMSVATKALSAFKETGINLSTNIPNPARAKALLKKVLGEDAKYASLMQIDQPNLAEVSIVIFVIDEIELQFLQGTTPEEDAFQVSYLNFNNELAVRTLQGLGEAIATSIHFNVKYIQQKQEENARLLKGEG